MLQLYQLFLYNTYFTTSLIAFNIILKILIFKVFEDNVFYRLRKRVLIVYEFVIFDSLKGTHKNDQWLIDLTINNVVIKSKPAINVLGVLFDSKLNWTHQVAQVISKAKNLLHAIKLIRKYFNVQEMKQLITSTFYSVLYYNYEIWLT